MQSQLTVRLPEELDRSILTIAERLHLKRSDIVRMALERFLEEFKEEEKSKPYEKVKALIGRISSGIYDLGEAHREHLLRKFKKHG
ncbi:MAG: ribbon-helix-helix protein, CopG family [Nitrospirae bacterium]|nr:ribbon-helix-helix protein, CopG family [Nitrospirota bacterium]